MFTILEKLGLPIPSKLTIILCVALLLSILLNLSQCKKINDKDEIIKGKEVEISVQNSTIKTLQTETQKSAIFTTFSFRLFLTYNFRNNSFASSYFYN